MAVPGSWQARLGALLSAIRRFAVPRPWRGRLAVAGLAAVLASQVYVRSAADEIVRQVASEASPPLSEAWSRYAFASRFTPFGLGLGEARESLRSAALTAAERVLSSYRESSPTPRQGDWLRAREHLQIALRLEPDDPGTRARLLYAQAHIDRIDAASLRTQEKTEEAERKWHDAIFRFRRAAELAPEWPDPFLGLARVYAYDRFDLDALSEALTEAQQRGFPGGARETAQLADGHLTEGKILYRRARGLDGEEREAELLEEAAFHLELAAAQYEEILGFGRAERNRREALGLAEAVHDRLDDVRFF